MIARTETPLQFRPRLVFAYGDSARAAQTGRLFRRLGWQVHLTNSGNEARRLVRLLTPGAVLLDTDLADESGWLTCAKLAQEAPGLPVFLLCDEVTPEATDYAAFAGATALAARTADLVGLVEEAFQSVETAAVPA